jgi:hypothetical protein
LFLAETLRLRSDAATMCIVPVVPKVGPATIGVPWPLPHMLSACPKEFQADYVVCGALTRGSRGAKVELHVFRCHDKEPLKTIRVPAGEDFTGAAAASGAALLACLAGEGVRPQANTDLDAVNAADAYAAALGHVLVQTLAANNLIEAKRLPPAAVLLDRYFKLAEVEGASALPVLLAIAGVGATMRYDANSAAAYKHPLLDLLDRRKASHPLLAQLAPMVYKLVGDGERATALARTLREGATGAYAEWLAGIN